MQENFTGKLKSDRINTLHNNSKHREFSDHKKGQSGLLCSNKELCDCPSLCYEYVESSERLNKAFDIVFEEVLLISLREMQNEINSDLC